MSRNNENKENSEFNLNSIERISFKRKKVTAQENSENSKKDKKYLLPEKANNKSILNYFEPTIEKEISSNSISNDNDFLQKIKIFEKKIENLDEKIKEKEKINIQTMNEKTKLIDELKKNDKLQEV